MSSISGVTSTTNPYLSTNQNDYGPSIQDFQAIGSALQSGNLTNAKQDYSSLQTDLKSTQSAHKGHHHHHSFSVPTSSTTATNPTASFLTNDDNSLNVTA